MNNCPYCGMMHQAICPKIKAIEYHADGITMKRIEFHSPIQIQTGSQGPGELPTYLWPRS